MDTRQYENETEYDIDYEKKNTSYSKEKLNKIISEYRITQNNFNPNKRTPPNSFIINCIVSMSPLVKFCSTILFFNDGISEK